MKDALDEGRPTEAISEEVYRRAIHQFQEENPGAQWALMANGVRLEYLTRAQNVDRAMMTISGYQSDVDRWLADTFPTFRYNNDERALRFLEEAIELFQAVGGREKHAHHLVEYVFNRPSGNIVQEIGGVLNTLATLATCHHVDLAFCAKEGLKDCWGRRDEIIKKQAMKAEAGVSVPLNDGPGPIVRDTVGVNVRAADDTDRYLAISRRLDAVEKLNHAIHEKVTSIMGSFIAKNRTKA
jgi:NTP pyrophosphatase (non-canonical NTP hydrolase)